MTKESRPTVLVCAPQHDSKNYCFDGWAENVQNFTYPEYDVLLVDNSSSTDNTQLIESKGFKAGYLKPHEKGVYFTMRDAHNACREYALENDYDFILHLETDIIPPIDIIERLLMHRRKVIGASYDINHGSRRQAMIQTDEPFGRNVLYRQVEMIEEDETSFFDGSVKQAWHVGLGCTLIHRSVLEQVEFEYHEGQDYHPDTFFAMRCHEHDIPIFVDTDIHCTHHNRTWIGKKDTVNL